MTKYRKKPVVIEAYKFDRVGTPLEREPQDVGYYRNPRMDGQRECQNCKRIMHDHGWIDTLEGGHIVCPGDWIITGVKGEKYPCKPDIFEATYEKVDDAPGSIRG